MDFHFNPDGLAQSMLTQLDSFERNPVNRPVGTDYLYLVLHQYISCRKIYAYFDSLDCYARRCFSVSVDLVYMCICAHPRRPSYFMRIPITM